MPPARIRLSLDHVSSHREAWGAYLLASGWAFSTDGSPVTAEGWLESSRLDRLLGRRLPLTVRTGVDLSELAEILGPECPSPRIGFTIETRLPEAWHDGRRLKLRLRFHTAGGETRKVDRVLLHAVRRPADAVEARLARLDSLSAGATKPNLFILGAAKCGTTSLHHTLNQHPEIAMSEPKEPCFFSPDFQVVADPDAYFGLFAQRPSARFHGESSHLYFSTPEVAPRLRRLFPDARFIVILRDPAERAYSLYRHMRRHGHEILPTFGQALDEEHRRFADPAFRVGNPNAFWNYLYVRSSRYDEQLARYLELFPREQFFVLTLGEWRSDPEKWQQAIFRFLGVRTDVPISPEIRNTGGQHEPLDPSTRARLDQAFNGLRQRAETLVGRTFEHWD